MSTDHIEDELKDRYKGFLENQKLEDNLERLKWLYKIDKEIEAMIVRLIQEENPTGFEDDSFLDWRKENGGK